ncbi:MAG: 50S ribosomal protein L32 [Leptolyngbya sp.]|nr:50S ribosomal protein L32 [Candidatus Melainabacteria bacterium]
MACPKKKTSHQKQHQRRAHWKATPITLNVCSNCSSPTRPHNVCIVCGFYAGRPARRRDNVITD